jgi:hypothetical protein
MTVLAWPSVRVSSFRWKARNNAIKFESVFGSQSLGVAAPQWEVEITCVGRRSGKDYAVDTFLEMLAGYGNQVELWNLEQPAPLGSMRGTITLRDPVPQGAKFIIAAGGTGQAGRTLKAGDLLGLGSGLTQQVVRAASDAVADASGNAYVNIVSPMRNAFGAGAAVTWDRPKALFRQASLNEGITYTPGVAQPWSLSLIEDWRL